MYKILKKTIHFFVLMCLSLKTYSQNDVTRFLNIPVDGSKFEMVQKLKQKGFTQSPIYKEELLGEFNGNNVFLTLNTNNNKVWRIIVADENVTNEANIKINFNNLLNQFANNQRYLTAKNDNFTIPEDEDISLEMTVKKKRYEALFFQKTIKYDSLYKEKELLLAKDKLDEKETGKLYDLTIELLKENSNCFNKIVWFTIQKISYGEYRIVIYYENIYNKAKGEGL